MHAETRSSFGPEQADSMGHSSDMATLAKDPPEGYSKVRIEQVTEIMANEIKGSLRPDTTGKMPMDEALELLRVDARVTMHVLPLPKGRSSNDKRALEDVRSEGPESTKAEKASYQESSCSFSRRAHGASSEG